MRRLNTRMLAIAVAGACVLGVIAPSVAVAATVDGYMREVGTSDPIEV